MGRSDGDAIPRGWSSEPFRVAAALIAGLAVAGCSLPRTGPVQSKILREASAETADSSVVPVSRDTVDRLATWPRARHHLSQGWPQSGRGPTTSLIATNDLIDLLVWESGDNPLLTTPNEKSVEIRGVTVSSTGSIFVPYVGEVMVRGMTADRARQALQERYDSVLDSPQVLLTVNQGRMNTVDLVGGVAKAGSYPLPDRNFTVLSLLGQGGGIPPELRNPQVRLIRGSQIYEMSARALLENPRRDTVLRGGDKVIVEEDQRYFLALGASSQQRQIHFPQDRVTALDAMALVGGVAGGRGDPEGILILRQYPADALRLDGTGPDRERTVFTLDLTSADGLFSAGRFLIEPNDLVLVTESPVNGLRTILGIAGQGVGIARAIDDG